MAVIDSARWAVGAFTPTESRALRLLDQAMFEPVAGSNIDKVAADRVRTVVAQMEGRSLDPGFVDELTVRARQYVRQRITPNHSRHTAAARRDRRQLRASRAGARRTVASHQAGAADGTGRPSQPRRSGSGDRPERADRVERPGREASFQGDRLDLELNRAAAEQLIAALGRGGLARIAVKLPDGRDLELQVRPPQRLADRDDPTPRVDVAGDLDRHVDARRVLAATTRSLLGSLTREQLAGRAPVDLQLVAEARADQALAELKAAGADPAWLEQLRARAVTAGRTRLADDAAALRTRFQRMTAAAGEDAAWDALQPRPDRAAATADDGQDERGDREQDTPEAGPAAAGRPRRMAGVRARLAADPGPRPVVPVRRPAELTLANAGRGAGGRSL
jgi:hypothetical protein